jgi:iron(III) transport system substrate-binding protein
MTGTQALSQSPLGWAYFEKLGKQKVMQVQSSTEPPKKLAQGERPVMADGNEYNVFVLKESGVPIEPVYATEGTPIVIGNAALLKNAPNPNAARCSTTSCSRARRSSSTATSAACAPSTPR